MSGEGSVLRSAAFNTAFIGWTAAVCLALWPVILLGRPAMRWAGRLWARVSLALLRRIVGLAHEVRGRERLPSGPAVVAAKHQSAWDTIVFFLLFAEPAYVLKRELMAIPILGWYLARVGMIPIDRKGGAGALRRMVGRARRALASGHTIIIFPEGTRTPPGEQRPYHPGVAALYRHLDVPVVPVALDSGRYWRRRAFRKRPGRIVLEFLPPIPPGLERREFATRLRDQIEGACARMSDGKSGESGDRPGSG